MKKLFAGILLGMGSLSSFAQWNSNTAVNLQLSTLSVTDMQATNTTDGKTWAAYYVSSGSGYKMYAQLLDVNGNKLLGQDGVLVDSNASGTATFVFNVCTDQEQNLIIGLQDQRTVPGVVSTVAYKINQSGTSVWNSGAGVVLGTGYSPMPVLLHSGELVLTWLASDGKLAFQKLDANGTAAWATPKELIQNSRRGQMTAMNDNGFVMIYQQPAGVINSKLYAQRFSNNGDSLWASSIMLSNESTSAARYYSVKQDADTTYVGYYTSSTANHFNSWLQRVNPDGAIPYGINGSPFSDYTTSADPNEGTTTIGIQPNSNFVWSLCTYDAESHTKYGTYVQKFDKATGQRSFNVLGKAVYALDTTRYAQQGLLTFKGQYPVFMVANDVNYLIKGSILNATGDFLLTPQDVVLSSTTITQPSNLAKGRFAFTENINGQSVALWTEDRGTGSKVYAQNFVLNNLDTSIAVSTVNNVPAVINVLGGTLNMAAAVLPATASQDVTWSIVPATGSASISTSGVVTAITNGTVWAKATANVATAYSDSLEITITNQTPNGISEIEKSIGFSAYPNPTSNVLNIEIKSNHPALTIAIMDINGRIILTQKVGANKLNAPQSLDLKNVNAGTYILQVTGEGIQINKKISKK